MKNCSKCKKSKELSEFYKNKGTRDGLLSHCKVCQTSYKKSYTRRNSDKIKKYNAKYYREHPHSVKDYERLKQWRCDNPEKDRAHSAKRRSAKLNASPNWLNSDQLRWIAWYYKQADLLEKLTGIKYHVDHIHPLQGSTVCGLHVPWNLQVIPASENLRKHNKLV